MMIDLPPMEFKFEINQKGLSTQKVYHGSFTYKRLPIGLQGRAEIFRCSLNGDMTNIDPEVNRLHEILGWLRYGIIESPEWWKKSNCGVELYDSNVVVEIYNRVNDFEKKWSEQVTKNAQSSTENSSKEV